MLPSRLLGFALIGCLLSGCIGGFAKGRPEWRILVDAPEKHQLSAEHVSFRSLDGLTITGWWIHSQVPPKAAVILAHGRGGNRSKSLGRAEFLVRNGYDAIPIDLRACGESEGEYPSPGYLETRDILGAVAGVRSATQLPIVLLGYSYGAVAVIHAASRDRRIAAVIADSPFISFEDSFGRLRDSVFADTKASWTAKVGIWFIATPTGISLGRWLLREETGVDIDSDRADVLPALARLDSPILFISGDADPFAPTVNARKMLAATRSDRKALAVLPGASHQTFHDALQLYQQYVLAFLQEHIH